MEFLWLANPANFDRCTDPTDPGARKGVWRGGNPFMASALAIEQFVSDYRTDTLFQLYRRAAEVCPWFKAEDRAAAVAAVEASSRKIATRAEGGDRGAVHWTEFPERVERFGDLFSILDTFEQDLRADLIHSGSLRGESDQSAYTVELMGEGRFIPRSDRVPGWEELATYAEREHYSAPSLTILRAIRGRASEVLDIPISAVNDMPITAVMAALHDAEKAPVTAPSDPLAELRWLKVTQVANLFALNRGQVSKLADDGTFVTNGNTGHDRRIDVLSVIKRELDRLAHQGEPGPSTD
jgi:hypothetical protein